jgi:hypothetical protein
MHVHWSTRDLVHLKTLGKVLLVWDYDVLTKDALTLWTLVDLQMLCALNRDWLDSGTQCENQGTLFASAFPRAHPSPLVCPGLLRGLSY